MKPRLRNVNRFSSSDKLDQVTRLQAKYVQKHRLSLAWSPHKDSAQQLVYIPPRLELGADPHSSPFCILHATESLWYRTHRHVLTSLHLTAAPPSLFYRSPKHMGGCLLSFFFFCFSGEEMSHLCVWGENEVRCTLGIARGPVPSLGLTPGTDITTIMEFYSLAEAFVKSERAARHFVLPQDRLCLAAFA